MSRRWKTLAAASGLLMITVVLTGFFGSPKPATYSRYIVSGTGDTTLVFPTVKSDINVENLGDYNARYTLRSTDLRSYPSQGDTNYVLGPGDTHVHENASIKYLTLHRASATPIYVIAKD